MAAECLRGSRPLVCSPGPLPPSLLTITGATTKPTTDALKFNGPAPEIINGRLAMLGILIVAQAEAETGETALQLLQHGTPWSYAAMALWVYASMVPILKGARHEAFGEYWLRGQPLGC